MAQKYVATVVMELYAIDYAHAIKVVEDRLTPPEVKGPADPQALLIHEIEVEKAKVR